MQVTRREFLLQTGQACLGYALGAAAFTAGVARFGLINAFAQGSDYKALVCVFLAGGNDPNNTIVPLDTAGYNAYSSVRSASGLAIASDQLLLMTDALAQWFLAEAEMGRRPWAALGRAQTQEAFCAFVDLLRHGGALRNDDTTLVRIEVAA